MAWFRAVDVTEAVLARWDAEESGRLVQTMREERGWTRSHLAQQAGTSHAELARFEMGRTVPAHPLLIRYLQALGYQKNREPWP
ncbi:helix-turn-helix transcriptional regulator [Actinophytocola sp.]|uniref:helix-turn-helix domain-containing protein n=1 Tax=Actinophytocola sp. TaxID=1872138 RepID=UPI00389ABDF1